MALYDYYCKKCDLEFEVINSMKDYNPKEKCQACGEPAERIFKYCKFHFTGTKIEDAEFNVGLGQITKSKRHRDELAKKLGVVEVGNEKPESIHKHFDSEREKKIKKSWDEV